LSNTRSDSPVFTRSNRNLQMVKAGINYRFNWGGYGY
jgi:hypothetical protein